MKSNLLRVLVCGSRSWTDRETIWKAMTSIDFFSKYKPSDVIIIHGNAKGADQLAESVAVELGYFIKRFPAEWNKYGKSAGMIRNKQMLEEGKPSFVLAFQVGNSPGTANMIKLVQDADMPIKIYNK
jgi:hypothetical protein